MADKTRPILISSKRVCQCPKDPRYPMFCIPALTWYQKSNPKSNLFESHANIMENYNQLKISYKKLIA